MYYRLLPFSEDDELEEEFESGQVAQNTNDIIKRWFRASKYGSLRNLFKKGLTLTIILTSFDAEDGDKQHLHLQKVYQIFRWSRQIRLPQCFKRPRTAFDFARCFILMILMSLITLIILTGIFNPSYSHRSPFTIPENEKIFIAANIIDEDLIKGPWGDAVIEVIELLGVDNVFLSIYGAPAQALDKLGARVKCQHALVSEDVWPIEPGSIPLITLPSGEQRMKRIAFLAEVRNRALDPLYRLETKFDKILFMNDVIFKPEDAARLLFSTNVINGKADYRAACAMDFINPFKFYDMFATRDAEGYSMGVPFFPWFANAGKSESRKAVLAGKDSVKVRSCWGGMVAFEAKWFQPLEPFVNSTSHFNGEENLANSVTGENHDIIRFRSDPDPHWDASECCLVHADLQYQANSSDSGTYINPFVRVAYDSTTFRWLGFVRRFERLYSIPQNIINRLTHMPFHNPRRLEKFGAEVDEIGLVSTGDDANNGIYEAWTRTAGIGGFCGDRRLLVMKENPGQGERRWEDLPIPSKLLTN